LTRAKFEQLTEDLLNRMRAPFDAVIKDGNMSPSDVDEVVLVGGATRMPMVQDLVRSLTGKEPHKGVNPDEVVAVGAAIQAGVLAGEVKDVLLLDVTPLTLGVETLGAVMTPLIERNTTIPVRKSEIFSTAQDGQTAVTIHVLQGERSMAADNMTLGQFNLEGIPPAPRGVPQVEVTFDIDANGILNVTAQDKATGQQQKIVITASTNLNKDEVERKVQEAKRHEAEDRKRRELIEARNTADQMIYQTEKVLSELDGQVPEADRTTIEQTIEDLRQVKDGDDADRIRQLTEQLQQASYAIGQQMYAQQAATEQGGNGGSYGPDQAPYDGGTATGTPEGEEFVDGEFREV
jgi:molecular chaperone DnaK